MVKSKDKSTARKISITGQAQRLGIFGASGCGKTTKARKLIEKLNRIIFITPLFDDLMDLSSKKFIIINNLDDLFNVLNKRFATGFKIAYYPKAHEEVKELSEISNFLMRYQAGYGFNHAAQITLVVDELDLSFPTGISLKDNRNGFKNLCCRGRHTGINIIGISQRMHLIDNSFRANCSALYLFRHTEIADVDLCVKILGREYKTQVNNLENYQYFYKCGSVINLNK